MRKIGWLFVSVSLALPACGNTSDGPPGDNGGGAGSGGSSTGGTTNTGGRPGTGGAAGSGGAVGTGGAAGADASNGGNGGAGNSGGNGGAGTVEAGLSERADASLPNDASTDGATNDGAAPATVDLTAALRFKKISLQVTAAQCVTVGGTAVSLAPCGDAAQSFRAQLLGPGYVALLDDASGNCLTATGRALGIAECTNGAAQQFSFTGTRVDGFRFTSLGGGSIAADLSLGATAAPIKLLAAGDADPLAVVVDERPIGWAAMPADIVVPNGAVPDGSQPTRRAAATTGGGTWEAARANGFANVTYRPADFAGAVRETAVAAFQRAMRVAGPSIIVLEAGVYDFSLTTPAVVNRCNATCESGGTYTQTGGFCPDNATCAGTAGCVVGGFMNPYRTLDVGSDKTIIGLGAGAEFRRLGIRFISVHNGIYRNIAHRDMPGNVRAWDDGLLFWPADHVWVDHVSFSGFGRGAVVLSGTRVTAGTSFATYRDSGWMTFSWLLVDSRETWRCDTLQDSPYPFFTTNDPSLTFHHVMFQAGHGRNPAIDFEGAHFFNTAWSRVSDGLDGRNAARLLVEGSWFDGQRPIRMDDPVQPVVLAPIDPATTTGNPRRVNFLSAAANTSLRADWQSRSLNVATLNTNAVAAPAYPYSLDLDPSQTLPTVTAGAGIGKGGFPACTLTNAATKQYACP